MLIDFIYCKVVSIYKGVADNFSCISMNLVSKIILNLSLQITYLCAEDHANKPFCSNWFFS